VIAKNCWDVMSLRLCGSVFTELLPRSGLHNSCSIVACVNYLEMAVSVAQPFLHGANMPQYKKNVYPSHYFLMMEMGDFGLLLLVFCLTYSLTPNMESICSSKVSDSLQTSVTTHKTTLFRPLQTMPVLNWHSCTHENILSLQSQWKFQVLYDLGNAGQQCK
jgi:hypothetical protein